MASATASMFQGFTRIAPLRDGEHPMNSDSINILFFLFAAASGVVELLLKEAS
jgi:hypothetical protein